MQVNSDVHCHSRLLFKPKPNGSGREYQLSPRRRVSHDITYKKNRGVPPCPLPFTGGSSSCNTLRPVTLVKPSRKGACQHAMTRRRFRGQEYPVYRTTPKAKL